MSGESREPKPQRQLRGLYDRVNISVEKLNMIIILLSIALVACLAFAMSHRGYQVTFDTLGGTVVESQTRMYGEMVEEPEVPTREGYAFDGWYRDQNTTEPWNLDTDKVAESMTLYARWRES